MRTVEHNTSALKNVDNADGVIQENEAAKFIRLRSQGSALAKATGNLAGADWRLAQDKAVFTAAAIKIQLMSRAKKARQKVEERRRRTEQMAHALDEGSLGAQFEAQGMATHAAQFEADERDAAAAKEAKRQQALASLPPPLVPGAP